MKSPGPERKATTTHTRQKENVLTNTYIGDEDFCVQRSLIDAQSFQKLNTQAVRIVILEIGAVATVRARRIIEAGRLKRERKWQKCRLRDVQKSRKVVHQN